MSCMVDGDPKSPLLIIGMSPGRDELRLDKPFMGASGRFLWSMLKREAGIDRADCYIVNTIAEWPDGKRGEVTPEQLNKFWDVFDDAVCQSKARVVLLLGGTALYRFTGVGDSRKCSAPIEDWRGYLLTQAECRRLQRTTLVETHYKTNTKLHRKGDPRLVKERLVTEPVVPTTVEWICPTLHPAGIQRTGFSTAPAFKMDIMRVGRALRGDLQHSRTDYLEYPAPYSIGPVAIDIETGGIDGGIVRVGVANRTATYTLRWDREAQQAVRDEVSDKERTVVFHNAAFDVPRLERASCRIPNKLWDTMLAAALVQPDLYKGLNDVASMYLDCKRWKHESEEHPAKYNAYDASRTLELYDALHAELEKTDQLELFEGTIMPCVPTLARMSSHGLLMDPQKRDEWVAHLSKEFDGAILDWQARTGVSVRAGKQVNDYLYGTLGLPMKLGKYGSVTSEESALRELATDYPEHAEILHALLKVRKLGKDLKTYAEVAMSPDGRVHPNYLPANKDTEKYDQDTGEAVGKGLAGTWRITAKSPNIQNQPKQARRMFVPSPGRIFIEFDYDQLEARILAAVSGDEALQAAIETGLHAANMELLGVDKTRAKNAFYGWSYFAGAKTLHQTFKQHGFEISTAACQGMLNAFSAKYRKARAFQERRAAEAEERFFVENAFGLRRYFQKRNQGPAAANHEMQSDGAIIIWKVLPAVERLCDSLGGALVTSVHDSVLVEMSLMYEWETYIPQLKEILEQPWNEIAPGFRVPVSVKVGMNWGEMETIKL